MKRNFRDRTTARRACPHLGVARGDLGRPLLNHGLPPGTHTFRLENHTEQLSTHVKSAVTAGKTLSVSRMLQ